MFIIHFLEYTISGWLYFIWLILMLTFSLACLGVVGDKVSKKRLKELSERREKEAEEEYEKAHELVEKQIQKSGVDIVYDPTAAGAKEVDDNYQIHLTTVSDDPNTVQSENANATPASVNVNAETNNENATLNVQDNRNKATPVQEVVDLDKVAASSTTVTVDSNSASNGIDVNASTPSAPVDNVTPIDNAAPIPEVDSTQKEQVPAVLVINDDGTSNV